MFIFGVLEYLGTLKAIAQQVGLCWIMPAIWAKQNPAPQFVSAKQFAFAVEGIGFIRRPGKPVTWAGRNTLPNWLMTPICQGAERTEHPTQKPLDVIGPLIAYASNPGDLVLDPFCGSGTTLVAAERLGRRAIGIERDPRWAAVARERLGQAPLDLPLFAEVEVSP